MSALRYSTSCSKAPLASLSPCFLLPSSLQSNKPLLCLLCNRTNRTWLSLSSSSSSLQLNKPISLLHLLCNQTRLSLSSSSSSLQTEQGNWASYLFGLYPQLKRK
uniref:Uncharacterized protein n=1 Tax=Nelumbo nucifera TaxID=4432 RepID=A0A822ZQA1_NELNU|nr:TPA_asm: hypothetical protein HUJ06_017349 [Nelumbo nucifera]